MFEQELYNQEVEPQEGELFHNYEVRNWNYSKRIYQILAISAVINIFGLAFLGNTEILTARGCDSPFVGRVCQVLDMAYVGAVLFGTEREYADVAYERTELGDVDITYIDVSGATPPLSYPEGYFQLANPVQFAMQQQMAVNPTTDFMPGFTPNPTIANDLIDKPQVTPAPNPNAFDGETPALFRTTPDKASRLRNRRPGNNTSNPTIDNKDPDYDVAKVDPTPQETPKITTTDPISGYELNKRPFKDLGNYVNDLLATKQVDLDSPFVLRAKGKLNKDGKLDPKTFKFDEVTAANPKMAEVVKEAIEALNDSGYLQYLKDLTGKDFELEVKQDETTLNAIVQSEVENDSRAKSIKSGLDFLIGLAKSRKAAATADQNDKDDLILLENATIETVGKKLVITFNVPKAVAQAMIQRKLQEQAREVKKENGTAQAKGIDNAVKKK